MTDASISPLEPLRSSRPRATARGSLPAWVTTALPIVPIVAIVLIAILAPIIAPYDPRTAVGASNLPPSAAHLFGTDGVGLDVFSRTVIGMQTSVRIGLIVVVLATVIGMIIGTFIGLAESKRGALGLLGRALNRVSDYIISVPAIVLGIVVVGLMGTSDVTLVLALTLFLVQAPIRLTRVEVLRVRKEAYLDAARMAGESSARIAFSHVLPNSMRPALANAPLVFGNSIIILASLGFLGIGVQPPTPEWGVMISEGISPLMIGFWWGTVFPSVFLFLTVLGVSYSARSLPRFLTAVRGAYRARTRKAGNA